MYNVGICILPSSRIDSLRRRVTKSCQQEFLYSACHALLPWPVRNVVAPPLGIIWTDRRCMLRCLKLHQHTMNHSELMRSGYTLPWLVHVHQRVFISCPNALDIHEALCYAAPTSGCDGGDCCNCTCISTPERICGDLVKNGFACIGPSAPCTEADDYVEGSLLFS